MQNTGGVPTPNIDTDAALTANSDLKVPSQKAIKSYVDGSWINYLASSTIVGFVSPAGTMYVKKVGKRVFVEFTISGTSNDTVLTFTLPYAIKAGSDGYGVLFSIYDNGGYLAAPGYFNMAASTVTCIKNFAGTAWVNANAKLALGSFSYETA